MIVLETWHIFWEHPFSFSGRSSRKEFWIMFPLLCIFEEICIMVIHACSFGTPAEDFMLWIFVTFSVAIVIFIYALFVRRFHDVGINDKWILLLFFFGIKALYSAEMLIISTILLIIYLGIATIASEKKENKYGKPPFI